MISDEKTEKFGEENNPGKKNPPLLEITLSAVAFEKLSKMLINGEGHQKALGAEAAHKSITRRS